ncbi:hypothetical protein E0493_04830 [Roseomonas sp. M0104]|uniref:Uncharacterized protein n=1 Tax=Teichococcus coralli TaxID=2545983 RepID=A0A845B830_9PROT|nr:hypothetical protein [Pseudoroseomonas coralli]MXP62678.1 hypothetical protein [Pseudoroseomonas coralli]
MPFAWIAKPADLTLCLSGYPVRIRLHTGREQPYTLEVDGKSARVYSSLARAKADAIRSARDWDEEMARILAD